MKRIHAVERAPVTQDERPRAGNARKAKPRPERLRLEPLGGAEERQNADRVEQALAAWRQQRPELPEEPVIEF